MIRRIRTLLRRHARKASASPPRPEPVPHAAIARMETLAPRTAYDGGDAGERLPALPGRALHTAVDVLERLERVRGRVSWPVRIVVSAVVGGFSGLFFNVLVPHTVLSWDRRVTDRIYAGHPELLPPPPSAGYRYRLPCGRMTDPAHAVGGVLYLGARGIRFDPHRRNRRRDRESLVIEPLRNVEIELVDAPPSAWAWWRRPVPRIRVRWPRGEAEFGVPDARALHPRMVEIVRGFQAARG